MLLAIDQGTTSTRALAFSKQGEILALSQKELPLHTPHSGWVEQDPQQIWTDTLAVCKEVLAQVPKIKAIGITNQRETTVLWDKTTGEPVYNAIVWQDRRTAEYCAGLKSSGKEPLIREKTGLLADPYFSGTKIRWILEKDPSLRARAEAGEILFGTIDSFLIWHLTGGKRHVTDITNASRTMLFNIRDEQWDNELCDMLGVPMCMLPEVLPNVAEFGETDEDLFGQVLPIFGVAGDQQAATIGQGCFEKGMVKSTYGTGCFALMNIGHEFCLSDHNLLTTIAYKIEGEPVYALEGSIFVAGAAVQFLRDNLKFFEKASESEKMALSVDDSDGVIFVPALTGLGAPYWNPDVRGAIFGLSRGTTENHIVRATLEAQAFQTKDLVGAMEQDSGARLQTLRVDGGLVRNDFVCQNLADLLDCEIDRPHVIETTAWGAACLAAIGAGIFSSLDEVTAQWSLEKKFVPENSQIASQYKDWQTYVTLLNNTGKPS